MKAAWRQDLKNWGQLLEERAELDHQVVLAQAARIEVLAGLLGDVDISFGKLTRHLRSGYSAGAFFLDDQGRVVFSAGRGKPDELV